MAILYSYPLSPLINADDLIPGTLEDSKTTVNWKVSTLATYISNTQNVSTNRIPKYDGSKFVNSPFLVSNATTVKTEADIWFPTRGIKDTNNNIGITGQVLSSFNGGLKWQNPGGGYTLDVPVGTTNITLTDSLGGSTDVELSATGNISLTRIDANNIQIGSTPINKATSTVLGTVKLNSDTVQNINAQIISADLNRTYGLQFNSQDQGVINVPWVDTQYAVFTGATAGSDGSTGLVPQPLQGEELKFLRADATWADNPGITYTLTGVTVNTTDFNINLNPSPGATESVTLKPGTNVTLTGGTNEVTINAVDQFDGTVTSITPAADSGTGTAITTVGTLTFTGSGDITTSVTGDTVTIDYTDTPYVLPVATSSALGGIKIGFTQANKNYPVVLNTDEQAFVNVPWTDNNDNTTYILGKAAGSTDLILKADGTAQDTITFSGTTNEVTVTGALEDAYIFGLPDDVTVAGELTVSGTGQSSFGGQITIPQTPSAATDAASKGYVDGLVSGGLTFRGTFRADTGEIVSGVSSGSFLYNCPGGGGTRIAVAVGDYYIVATAGGSFYCSGATLDIGDSIIATAAASANASVVTGWSIVQSDEGVTDFSSAKGTYIDITNNTNAVGSVDIGTVDLNAQDDNAGNTSTRFLTKTNKWEVPSYTTNTNTIYDLENSGSGNTGEISLVTGDVVATADVNGASSGNSITYDNESPASGIVDGQIVRGTGITAGTRVVSHTATVIVLNQVANVANNAVLSFHTADTISLIGAGATVVDKNSGNIRITSTDTQYSAMTTSTLGLGKIRYDNNSTPAANTQSTLTARTYGVTKNTDDQLIVNVPWTDTQNAFQTITGTGSNNTDSGILLSDGGGTVKILGDGTFITAAQSGNTITLTGSGSDTTYTYTSAQSTNDVDLILTDSNAATNIVKLVKGSNITLTDSSNSVTIAAQNDNDNDFLTGLAFNTGDGVLTATVQNQSNVTVDLDGRYALSSGSVSGGGTTQKVVKFTNTSTTAATIGDGPITFSTNDSTFAGNVGIGGAPSVNFEVNKTGARVKLIDGTNQLNMGLWDGSNYRFEGDANRPMFFTSYQGNINFGISGGTTMTIQNGKVGIPSTAANVKLNVISTDANWTSIMKNYTTGAYGLSIDCSGAASANYVLAAYTPSGTGMFLNGDGELGIGTTTPDSLLQLESSANPDVELKISNTATVTSGQNFGGSKVRLIADGTNGDGHGALRHALVSETDSYSNWEIRSANSLGTLAFDTLSVERMRLTSDGNVSIQKGSYAGQDLSVSTNNLEISGDIANGTRVGLRNFGSASSIVLFENSNVPPGFAGYSRTGTTYMALNTSGQFNIGGTSGTGAEKNAINMDFSDGSLAFSQYGSGNITGTAAYTLAVDSSGNVIETSGGGGGTVTGNGTANTLPKWTGNTALGNSEITDTGSVIQMGTSGDPTLYLDTVNKKVGFRTSTPASAMDVNGTLRARNELNVGPTTEQNFFVNNATFNQPSARYIKAGGYGQSNFLLSETTSEIKRTTPAFGTNGKVVEDLRYTVITLEPNAWLYRQAQNTGGGPKQGNAPIEVIPKAGSNKYIVIDHVTYYKTANNNGNSGSFLPRNSGNYNRTNAAWELGTYESESSKLNFAPQWQSQFQVDNRPRPLIYSRPAWVRIGTQSPGSQPLDILNNVSMNYANRSIWLRTTREYTSSPCQGSTFRIRIAYRILAQNMDFVNASDLTVSTGGQTAPGTVQFSCSGNGTFNTVCSLTPTNQNTFYHNNLNGAGALGPVPGDTCYTSNSSSPSYVTGGYYRLAANGLFIKIGNQGEVVATGAVDGSGTNC